jgi:Flp pilus assembly protein TadD
LAEVNINEKVAAFLKSAISRSSSKDFSSAIEDLKAAEVLDKENPIILYNLGICYIRTGLHRTAREYFEKLISLSSTFIDILTVRKLFAYSSIMLNDFQGALVQLDDCLKITPRDIVSLNMKGYCLEKLGLFAEASLAYGEILSLESSNPTACNSLAYVLARSGGDLNRAMILAKKAVATHGDNAAYLDTLGYIHLLKGNRDSAKNMLKKAFSRMPDSEEIKAHLKDLLDLHSE